MPYRMLLFAATFQNGCRTQTALQFLSIAVESFKGLLKQRNSCLLYHISVITMTPALATYKQKLFYHIQAKGTAMFGNFILFAQPLLYLILLHWTFKLLIAACQYAYCVQVNGLRSALLCCSWELLVGIQCCNRFASVVGSVRVCSGT